MPWRNVLLASTRVGHRVLDLLKCAKILDLGAKKKLPFHFNLSTFGFGEA